MNNINKRYDIIKELGSGEFGTVYQVRDNMDDAIPVKALKVFNSDKYPDKIDSFFNEFNYIRSIYLSCAVRTFEFGSIHFIDDAPFDGNYKYYTMEFVDGITLQDYLFLDSQERDSLLAKITFNVNWLHSNGFWHGDLRPENIIITLGNDIIFIDFMSSGDIGEEDGAFAEFMDEKYGFDVKKSWDGLSGGDVFTMLTDTMRKRKKFGFGLVREPIADVLKRAGGLNDGSRSLFLNLPNFNDDYYTLFLNRFSSLAAKNGYEFAQIFLNQDRASIVREVYMKLLEMPRFSARVRDEKTEISGIMGENGDFLTPIDPELGERLLSELINTALSVSPVVFALMNTRKTDRLSKQLLASTINSFSEKGVIIISNDNDFHPVADENRDIDILNEFTDPLSYSYYSIYNDRIRNLLMNFKSGFPKGAFDGFSSLDILKIFRYIQSITADEVMDIIKKGHMSYDPGAYNEDIFNAVVRDYQYLKLFIYMRYMDLPARNSLLAELMGSSYPDIKRELLIDGLLNPAANNMVNIADAALTGRIVSVAAKLPADMTDKINRDVIRVYENIGDDLSFNERFALAKAYFTIGDTEKMRAFLLEHIIKKPSAPMDMIENTTGWFIQKWRDEPDTSGRSDYDMHLMSLLYAMVVLSDDTVAQLKELLKIEKRYNADHYLNYKTLNLLFGIYFMRGDTENMNVYLQKMKKIQKHLDIYDSFDIGRCEIQYYYLRSEADKMMELSRKIMRKASASADPGLYKKQMSLFPFLSHYYTITRQDKKELALLKAYLKRAFDAGEPRFIYSAHTHFGSFYFSRGETIKSREHFELAAAEAEKLHDPFYMMQSYNNLSVNEKDTAKSVEYLYKALKYSEQAKDEKNRILIISNITESVPAEEAYALISKNSDLTKISDSEDAFVLNHSLKFLFNYITVLARLGKKDEMLSLADTIRSYRIAKRYSSAKNLRKLCLAKINIRAGGDIKKARSAITEVLKDLDQYTLYEASSILFDDLVDILTPASFRPFAEHLIRYHSLNGTIQNIPDIIIWHRITYDARLRDPVKLRRYIHRYYGEASSIPYIRDSIMLSYSHALREAGDKQYLNYLSHFIIDFRKNKDMNREDTIANSTLFKSAAALFPSHEDALLRFDDSPFSNQDTDCMKIALDISAHNSLDSDSFFRKTLATALYSFGYERAILVKNTFGSFRDEFTLTAAPFLYGPNDAPLYMDHIREIKDDVLEGAVSDNPGGITGYMIMPVVDKKVWSRIKRENTYSYSATKKPLEYLHGFLYFDKKHNVSFKRKDISAIQSLTALYFAEFWNSRMAEERFMRDKLTGLYFRDVFMSKVSEYLYDGDAPNRKTVSFLMVDIDDFKVVNDTFGHQKGDNVLKEVAAIISKSVRSYDISGRYGGEEFIIALPNTSHSNARKVATRIKNSIAESRIMGAVRRISVSIGISHYPEDSLWLEELIQKADQCMYAAKKAGKNSVVSTSD